MKIHIAGEHDILTRQMGTLANSNRDHIDLESKSLLRSIMLLASKCRMHQNCSLNWLICAVREYSAGNTSRPEDQLRSLWTHTSFYGDNLSQCVYRGQCYCLQLPCMLLQSSSWRIMTVLSAKCKHAGLMQSAQGTVVPCLVLSHRTNRGPAARSCDVWTPAWGRPSDPGFHPSSPLPAVHTPIMLDHHTSASQDMTASSQIA